MPVAPDLESNAALAYPRGFRLLLGYALGMRTLACPIRLVEHALAIEATIFATLGHCALASRMCTFVEFLFGHSPRPLACFLAQQRAEHNRGWALRRTEAPYTETQV